MKAKSNLIIAILLIIAICITTPIFIERNDTFGIVTVIFDAFVCGINLQLFISKNP